MAFELLALLLIAVFIGGKIDEYLSLEDPWITILFIFLAMGGWFVRLYKDVTAEDWIDRGDYLWKERKPLTMSHRQFYRGLGLTALFTLLVLEMLYYLKPAYEVRGFSLIFVAIFSHIFFLRGINRPWINPLKKQAGVGAFSYICLGCSRTVKKRIEGSLKAWEVKRL